MRDVSTKSDFYRCFHDRVGFVQIFDRTCRIKKIIAYILRLPMCSSSYHDYKQASTMAMTSSCPSGGQLTYQGNQNWFASSGYYHNPAAHPAYYHATPMQQHQMLSIMQVENAAVVAAAAQNSPPQPADTNNILSWSAAHHNYHHHHHHHHHQQHQNFSGAVTATTDWLHNQALINSGSGSQTGHTSEYSPDDSDISPSPASNRATSPAYVPTLHDTIYHYDWMKKTSFQADQPSPGKTRTKDKYRVVYTDQQRVELEKEFLFNKYITIRRKTEMAHILGLSERQVKIWFQNRRAKQRKQDKKKYDLQADTILAEHHLHSNNFHSKRQQFTAL